MFTVKLITHSNVLAKCFIEMNPIRLMISYVPYGFYGFMKIIKTNNIEMELWCFGLNLMFNLYLILFWKIFHFYVSIVIHFNFILYRRLNFVTLIRIKMVKKPSYIKIRLIKSCVVTMKSESNCSNDNNFKFQFGI